ncbi:MAG: SRPBCC domain-containing protein [Gemmatimonadota bacterium]
MSDRKVIERVWQAPIDLIWELWTTAEGIASWFGPRGFTVEVDEIDLRVGGAFSYTMRATDPDAAAAMEKRGRPTSFSVVSTFTEVDPPNKLAYDSPMLMPPDTETMTTAVEFSEGPGGVKMVLAISATKPGMTEGAAMGWKSSLERFAEQLA